VADKLWRFGLKRADLAAGAGNLGKAGRQEREPADESPPMRRQSLVRIRL
jgi:hypothetical protein